MDEPGVKLEWLLPNEVFKNDRFISKEWGRRQTRLLEFQIGYDMRMRLIL